MLKIISVAALALILLAQGAVASEGLGCFVPAPDESYADPTLFLLPAPKEVGKAEYMCRVSHETRIEQRKIASWQTFFDSPRDLGRHGYVLEIGRAGVIARATTDQGLFYASQTFSQLAGFGVVPSMMIVDWPDVPDRMPLYDVRGTTVQVAYWKRLIDVLSGLKVNRLMPFLENDFNYRSYPYLGRPQTFTPEKAREIVAHAQERHLEIVPQLESFAHGESILDHPQLEELRHNGSTGVYNPCNEKTYELFRGLYRELVEAFPQSPLFHVGGDEVRGWVGIPRRYLADDARCREAAGVIGESGLFVRHIHRLQEILRPYGKRIGIWGDEVLADPTIAQQLDKGIAIFDWHYEDTLDFPSLKKFKDWGFREIWAAPAVHGIDDVYPWVPLSFGNIAGFVRAAVAEKIAGVVTTTWSMGSGAENYLYGLAYSASVTWNSAVTDIADFNRRFAYAWFGTAADGAALHVDRLFWFPWRIGGPAAWDTKDIEGYWQERKKSAYTFFEPYDTFVRALREHVEWQQKENGTFSPKNLSAGINEELQKRIAESEELFKRVHIARSSLAWLRRESVRNFETFDSMGLVLDVYEHFARKTIVVYGASRTYSRAYDAGHSSEMIRILDNLKRDIMRLKEDFLVLRIGYARAIEMRGGLPSDLQNLENVEASLETMYNKLCDTANDIFEGKGAPSPESIGL